jgi:hypothetical protein
VRSFTVIAIFGLVLAPGPASPEERHPLGMPSYPTVTDSRFTGVLETNQVPVDAAVLITGDDIETVMKFFHAQFAGRQDVDWVQNWMGPGSGYAGYFDPNSGTMRMVTAVAMPSGSTMLIYSSMDPRPLTENQVQVPADLPTLVGARDVVTTETGEGGERQRTVGFRIDDLSVDQIEKKLAETGSKLGWKQVRHKLGDSKDMLLFHRGRDRCIIAVRAKKDGEETYSQVTMVVNDRLPEKTSGARP